MKCKEFEKEISLKYKPVLYIKFEENLEKDREFVGEYQRMSYALICNKKDDYYYSTRPIITVFIRFKDNTGFKMNLEPKDYLGLIKESLSEIKSPILGKDLLVSNKRNFDYDKILNTILNKLNKIENYNPTLETIDLLTNNK